MRYINNTNDQMQDYLNRYTKAISQNPKSSHNKNLQQAYKGTVVFFYKKWNGKTYN